MQLGLRARALCHEQVPRERGWGAILSWELSPRVLRHSEEAVASAKL